MKKFALSNLLALTLALGVVASTGLPAQADAPLVTISGTVVSITDEILVLQTDKGNLMFDLDKNTEMPANIAVGNRITVSYDSDDNLADKMDARRIVMAPEPTPAAPVSPASPTPEPAPQPQTSAPAAEEEQGELPATASPLALVGGMGLLALTGGLLLRKRAGRK
ncbi:MAG: hypothetical protein ACREOU_03720 [Candidatus Eiseniibacteriota bacterium]